ncbi:MAG: hypothetical protein ABSC23_02120 [Bryobacteraceae bacterium]|jgi:hypothetical protein
MEIRKKFMFPAVLACFASLLPSLCFAQSNDALPKFGIGVNAGTLGVGVQAATAVARKSNVRFGFNYFSYSGSSTSSSSNITFNGKLQLESAELLFDQYIAGGFHISPGMAIYDGNKATGNAAIPAGHTFTLNSVTYFSGANNPVAGTGSFTAGKVAPELLFGFGNLLPRSSRHFSVNFDFGVIFTRSPVISLNLAGDACAISATSGCASIQSTPSVMSNLQAQQAKLNNDAGPYLKYWPVIRLGIGYKF